MYLYNFVCLFSDGAGSDSSWGGQGPSVSCGHQVAGQGEPVRLGRGLGGQIPHHTPRCHTSTRRGHEAPAQHDVRLFHSFHISCFFLKRDGINCYMYWYRQAIQ